MLHHRSKDGSHICKPQTYRAVQEVSLMADTPEHRLWEAASRKIAHDLISEASVFSSTDDEIAGVRIMEWSINVILPGDDDSMWFVRALDEAREEGRKEGLRRGGEICREEADRMNRVEAGVCSGVLIRQAKELGRKIENET